MERLEQGARVGMQIVEGSGNPPLVVARPMKGGHFAVLRFIVRFDQRSETERVRTLIAELGRALLDLGYVPYKCPATLYPEVARRLDPGFRELMGRVRRAIDPNGILNPDRWKLP
jgi:FAD/FMN-containing dehydrogenase